MPAQSRPPYQLSLYIKEGEEPTAPADWQKQLENSQVVGRAIVATVELEWRLDRQHPWPVGESESSESGESESEYESQDEELNEQVDFAAVTYKHAIRRVQKAFPSWAFIGVEQMRDANGGPAGPSDNIACAANSMPCECGRGRTGLWPWQLQAESRGFCLCISDERIHWVKRSLGEQAVFDAFPSVIGWKE